MHILSRFLLSVLSLLAIAHFVPGFTVDGLYIALIVALLLGLANITVKPILYVLTLPINLLTFGLFVFVINAFLLWFISTFVEGFDIAGFAPALAGALIMSAIAWLGNQLLKSQQ
jgi:putative membrane protein